MPKGRGANERRRSIRQKVANRMNRIARSRSGVDQARYEHWADARRARMRGRRPGRRRVRWSIKDAKAFSDGYHHAREQEAEAKRVARKEWAA